ncbi:ABC transporter substrate-binding protein [Pseudovibrio sp. Tun.PSC04-5.I4]|uniref:ABC transporter substrate-binding protein n=1 Tax=Pseudovibrio sp. Tun.PSC04-5.I4 TaxID=1798213 RepID=UPI00087F9E90|nr:ABC transporter substrate-binding protein [Pseudovibrio sp. Tun.PSC04-5.I4]SDQ22770.1 putative spermidine/putrescine transport system substrate-binding protein [Pseudovibrio sp. Tun.PSC04-5.I4]
MGRSKALTQQMLLASTLALASLSGAAQAEDAPGLFRSEFLKGNLGWEDVTTKARAQGTVNFYYWGGSDILNLWMDQVAQPALAAEGVKLNPVRITATKDTIDVVIAELAAGRGEEQGSVDLIWVNGENFYSLKQQNALWGAFANRLPNSMNFEWDESDTRSLLNLRDFGVKTGYQEMPWSGEQYVCSVNRAHVPVENTPTTFSQLKTYLKANPGKFTYVKPPHYLGNTFVQSVLYAHNPDGTGAEPYQKSFEELGGAELARLMTPGFEYLKSLEPLLLGGSSGSPRYAENSGELDNLFLNSEVNFSCKFGVFGNHNGLITGAYPEQAEEMIFPTGNMIKNKNYLAVPLNSPNPAAALVAINYFSSMEAQASMLKTAGMPVGLDLWRLTAEENAVVEAAAPPHYGVTQQDFDDNIAPDTNASLVDVIEATWLAVIERKEDKPLADIIAEFSGELNN